MTSPLPFSDAETAALLAAGGLTADEERAVLDRAKLDTALADELRKWDGLVETLVSVVAAEAPPERLKASLLQRIGERSPRILMKRAGDTPWTATSTPGVLRRMLRVDRERSVCSFLMRLEPGAVLPGHIHAGAEECVVLSGDLRTADGVLTAGDYFFAEAGSTHSDLTTVDGCDCFLIAPLSH